MGFRCRIGERYTPHRLSKLARAQKELAKKVSTADGKSNVRIPDEYRT